jgi:hypothetical protein
MLERSHGDPTKRKMELYNLQDQGIMDKIHRQVLVPYLIFKMADGTSIAPGIRLMSRAPYFCAKCIDKTIERRRQPSPPLPSSHTHIKLFGQYLWHKQII